MAGRQLRPLPSAGRHSGFVRRPLRDSVGATPRDVAVDSSGLLFDKKRDDLFRHWLLGLGSGDLHIKTGGPSNIDFDLPNVLFIGTKLSKVQDMLREKEVAEQGETR